MCPEEEPMKAPDQASVYTVLLVEDEVLIRLGVAEHLREAGFNVVEAATATEAREIMLAGVAIDLVFSDINMPGELDGVGLAKWLSVLERRNARGSAHLSASLMLLTRSSGNCASCWSRAGAPSAYSPQQAACLWVLWRPGDATTPCAAA
jgi:CheY-like chemotaxis protein